MCDAGSCDRGRIVAIAERDVEEAGPVPRESRAVAAAGRTDALRRARSTVLRVGDEDVLGVGERRRRRPIGRATPPWWHYPGPGPASSTSR